MATLELVNPSNVEMNSRFCWVCGKIGTESVGLLKCYRHSEGEVRWAVYVRPLTVLNDAISYRGHVVQAMKHEYKSVSHP